MLSYSQWFELYHKESEQIGNTKREYKYAFLGVIKLSIGFGLFAAIFTIISVSIGNLFSGFIGEEIIPISELLIYLYLMPLATFLINLFLMFISFVVYKKQDIIFKKLKLASFLEIMASGSIGWFMIWNYLGNNKKNKTKFDKKEG